VLIGEQLHRLLVLTKQVYKLRPLPVSLFALLRQFAAQAIGLLPETVALLLEIA
jgi:hypothetical protein